MSDQDEPIPHTANADRAWRELQGDETSRQLRQTFNSPWSGTVTFKNGTTTLGTGTLSGGKASFATSALAIGSHSITASYAGAGHFAASTSATLMEVIQ